MSACLSVCSWSKKKTASALTSKSVVIVHGNRPIYTDTGVKRSNVRLKVIGIGDRHGSACRQLLAPAVSLRQYIELGPTSKSRHR